LRTFGSAPAGQPERYVSFSGKILEKTKQGSLMYIFLVLVSKRVDANAY
jgi:hypothetical protein